MELSQLAELYKRSIQEIIDFKIFEKDNQNLSIYEKFLFYS